MPVNRTRYVQGFVGAFSSTRASALPPPPTAPLLPFPNDYTLSDGFRLRTFGRSRPTLDSDPPPGLDASVWIRGRPFELGSGAWDLATGCPRLDALDGRFSLCSFAPTRQRLLLATDILGAGGLYWHLDHARRTLFFGTHLGLLASTIGHPLDLDPLGSAAVLAGSASIGRRTPYKDLHRAGPAGMVTVTIDGDDEFQVEVAAYADPFALLTAGADPIHTESAIFEALDSLLGASLERELRHAGPNTSLMLSGGMDSAALALSLTGTGRAATTNGHAVKAVTYGSMWCRDVCGARVTAHQLNLRHRAIPYSGWNLSTYRDLVVRSNGGLSGLQTAHNLVGFDRARTAGFGTAIVGFLGDALTGAHLPEDDAAPSTAPLLPFERRWLVPLEGLYGRELTALREELDSSQRHPDAAATHHRSLFQDLVVRQATWISSTFDLCGWPIDVCYPFFSRELLRLPFRLPPKALRRQSAYRAWLSSRLNARLRDTGGRRPLFHARLTALRAARSISRSARRPEIVDWRSKIRESLPEWRQLCSAYEGDERLRTLCLRELDVLEDGRLALPTGGLSSIMLGIALIAAHGATRTAPNHHTRS